MQSRQEKAHSTNTIQKKSAETATKASPDTGSATRMPAWANTWDNNLPASLALSDSTLTRQDDSSNVPIAPSLMAPMAPFIQRAPLGSAPAPATTPATPAVNAQNTPTTVTNQPAVDTVADSPIAAPCIVEDDASDLKPGQMKRTEFLAALREDVCKTADEALAGTIWSSVGCPWVTYWFGYYGNRSSQQIEKAIRRYTAEAANVTDARDYIPLISRRVRRAIATWSTTGEVTGVPEGAPTNVPQGSPAPATAATTTGTAPATPGASTRTEGVQLKSSGDSRGTTADPEAIRGQLGEGYSLDGSTQSRMGSAFGTDFSHVRVHTQAQDAVLAKDLNARAFTVGNDVAFGPGEYRPGTPVGDALIAHELAHVVQQRGASNSAAAMSKSKNDAGYNALEADADQSAFGAIAAIWGGTKSALANIGQNAMPQLQSGLSLRRCDSSVSAIQKGFPIYGSAPKRIPEKFEKGNIPGEIPVATPTNGFQGYEFRFDGDGDQMKELYAQLRVTSKWPDGSARMVHVEITQLSSKEVRGANFELPDTEGGKGALAVVVKEVTDGKRPTEISLISTQDTQVLLFYPPERTADKVSYRAELASKIWNSAEPAKLSQAQNFIFPPEKTPLRQVFNIMSSPKHIGDIWSLDVKIGAYGDPFRLTFQKPDVNQSAVIFGISVLSSEKEDVLVPVAGYRADLTVNGPLNVIVLASDGIRLSLDLNGDGRPDVEMFHRMRQLVQRRMYTPEYERYNFILMVGPGVSGEKEFYYTVTEPIDASAPGMILAGSSSPHAEDFAAASNAAAVSSLAQEQTVGVPGLNTPGELGTLQGELDAVDTLLNSARQRANKAKILSDKTFKAWDELAQDFIIIKPYVQLRLTPPLTAEELKTRAQLKQKTLIDARSFSLAYVGEFGYKSRLDMLDFQLMEIYISQDRWVEAAGSFRDAVAMLDRSIISKIPKGGHENDLLTNMNYLVGLRKELGDLEQYKPVHVAAVFHPEEPFLSGGKITDQPLSLYYWQQGSSWKVKDVTNPEDTPSSDVDKKPDEKEPPQALFEKLVGDGKHYPRGILHYLLPSGAGGQVQATGPGTWRKVVTWIGLGAAAIGLGLLTFGTGSALAVAVGSWALGLSAVVGAGMAAIDLWENYKYGTLTPKNVIVDIATIVAAATGIGALRAGRILAEAQAAARTAEAGGASLALSESAALDIAWAGRWIFPFTAANFGTDVINLAVFVDDAIEQYDMIEASSADPETKRRAKILLLGQFALTAGFTVLSIKGNVSEFTRGRSVRIEVVNGVPYAIPVGPSIAGKKINASRASVEAATDPVAARTAEQTHLETIRSQIGGKEGDVLADVEKLALRSQKPEGTLVGDAHGNLTLEGQSAGTMQDLVNKVVQANNLSRAHGIDAEYVIDIQPGATPGTSKIRITSRTRPSTPITVTPRGVAIPPAARAEDITNALQRLIKLDPQSKITAAPDGRISINNQIDIYPERLAEIKGDGDRHLVDLLQITRELEAQGGDVSKLTKDQKNKLDFFSNTRSYRLRYRYQLQQKVNDFLVEVGLDQHPLFKNATEADRWRLFELVNEGSRSGAPNFRRQAANYALSSVNPQEEGAVRKFADMYQFYGTQFDATVEDAIETARRAGQKLSEKAASGNVERQMGDTGDIGTVNQKARDQINAAYAQGVKNVRGRIGISRIEPGLSVDETRSRIENLPALTFAEESAAVYHGLKHPDLPPEEELSTDSFTNYLASARKTVKDATQFSTAAFQLGGGRNYYFTRVFRSKDGFTYTMTAIVAVTSDGSVSLSTFYVMKK